MRLYYLSAYNGELTSLTPGDMGSALSVCSNEHFVSGRGWPPRMSSLKQLEAVVLLSSTIFSDSSDILMRFLNFWYVPIS
jgi:hypothetical protein